MKRFNTEENNTANQDKATTENVNKKDAKEAEMLKDNTVNQDKATTENVNKKDTKEAEMLKDIAPVKEEKIDNKKESESYDDQEDSVQKDDNKINHDVQFKRVKTKTHIRSE